jgi:hypothetical protein
MNPAPKRTRSYGAPTPVPAGSLRTMRCSAAINVDRLKPFVARVDAPPPPGPVTDAGQEGEHEAELLLSRRTMGGVIRGDTPGTGDGGRRSARWWWHRFSRPPHTGRTLDPPCPSQCRSAQAAPLALFSDHNGTLRSRAGQSLDPPAASPASAVRPACPACVYFGRPGNPA